MFRSFAVNDGPVVYRASTWFLTFEDMALGFLDMLPIPTMIGKFCNRKNRGEDHHGPLLTLPLVVSKPLAYFIGKVRSSIHVEQRYLGMNSCRDVDRMTTCRFMILRVAQCRRKKCFHC